MIHLNQLANQYKDELLGNVVPFWLEHSQDKEYGGYFSCLDRVGNVYDTDKFIWMQGRQVWLFSMLYNHVEQRREWLDCALLGGEFLRQHGHDGNLNWYFSLERAGKPLVEPYNIFAYAFAAMAFAELSVATGNAEYADIARRTFDLILSKVGNPKGKWSKIHPGTRPLKGLAIPMILCNLCLVFEPLLGWDHLRQTVEPFLHDILEVFYRPELGGIVVENVLADGALSDSFEGRRVTPGHAIEVMWFVIELCKRLNRPEGIERAKNIVLTMLDYGWDKQYRRPFLFSGSPRTSHTPVGMGSETLVGAYRDSDFPAEKLLAYEGPPVPGMVHQGPRLHLVSFQGLRLPRMVWLPEPAGRAVALLERGNVERLLPPSKRVV